MHKYFFTLKIILDILKYNLLLIHIFSIFNAGLLTGVFLHYIDSFT